MTAMSISFPPRCACPLILPSRLNPAAKASSIALALSMNRKAEIFSSLGFPAAPNRSPHTCLRAASVVSRPQNSFLKMT